MVELVAGLTVVFAGYVLYEVFKTVSQTNKDRANAAAAPSEAPKKPVAATPPKPAAAAPSKPAPAAAPAKTAAPPRAAAPAKAAPVPVEPPPAPPVAAVAKPAEASVAADVASGDTVTMLRDPSTGETCAVPTNYRFAKKWVKEALIAEGLLDKIYKNSDLDDKGAKKVKDALERLKSIAKYQG